MPTEFGHCIKIPLVQHLSENGFLTMLADQGNPFLVQRAFSVQGKNGDVRGQHAHRTCTQFLVCLRGEIEVVLQDAMETLTFALHPGRFGLLIPPMIWGSQRFLGDESIMVVLADGEYDENEYIRDWDAFVQLVTERVET